MYCKHCGKEIAEYSKYCNLCGKPVKDIKPSFKFPKLGVIGYIYILWFIIHFCLFLFGGQGYTVQYGEYWHGMSIDKKYSPSDYLYPDGPIRIYWGTNYYDITDLIFYVIVLPVVASIICRLYKILRQK